jgi:phosphomannomutase
MKNQNTVLFDMDGTLTLPRCEIQSTMIYALESLARHTDIGIVTGSDYDYILEQCHELFSKEGFPINRLTLYPCNGTKVYKPASRSSGWNLVFNNDMRAEIGQDVYNDLLKTIMSYQLIISAQNDLPYTGTFFQYRGSMLNWCPIGRSASAKEREAFVEIDSKKEIRKDWVNQLTSRFDKDSIPLTAALGGSTSVDIYPVGWDKTFSLKHLEEDQAWFVGDKCFPGGNDWELYEELKKTGRSFITKCPSQTIEIIEEISALIIAQSRVVK